MNNHTTVSITDLHYLHPDSPVAQWQIYDVLEDLGTPLPVIDWFFVTLEEHQREYSHLQQRLRETEARLSEE